MKIAYFLLRPFKFLWNAALRSRKYADEVMTRKRSAGLVDFTKFIVSSK